MALIKCPECGKEVSSQLKKCNNCGYKLKQVSKKKKRNIITISLLILVLLVVSLVGIITINNKNEEKRNKEYHDLLVETGGKIYLNSLMSELYCSEITKIWYESIFDRKSVYYGESFSKNISEYLEEHEEDMETLKSEKNKIDKMVVKLQNRPNENYKDSYDKVIELYGTYKKLTDQAISPTGTYNDYVRKYNNYSEELKSTYEQLTVLIPEIKNYKSKSKK